MPHTETWLVANGNRTTNKYCAYLKKYNDSYETEFKKAIRNPPYNDEPRTVERKQSRPTGDNVIELHL